MTPVSDLALELLHTLNFRPLEVVQNARTMQKHVTSIFKQPRRTVGFRFLELDEPFSLVLVPVTANNFGSEGHKFPKAPDVANLVQVLPNVWCVGEEAWPVGLSCSQRGHRKWFTTLRAYVEGERIGVSVTRDVAAAT